MLHPITNRKRKGYFILLNTLVAGAVSLAISISLLLLGLGFSRSSFTLQQSGQAQSLASACAEAALQLIADSFSYTGQSSIAFTEGNCTYNITGTTVNDKVVTSTGTVGTVVRKTRITFNSSGAIWQEEP